MRRTLPFIVILIVLPLLAACGQRSEPELTLDLPTPLPTYTPVVAEAEVGGEAKAKAEAEAEAEGVGADASLEELAEAAAALVAGQGLTATSTAGMTETAPATSTMALTAPVPVSAAVPVTTPLAVTADAPTATIPAAATQIVTAATDAMNTVTATIPTTGPAGLAATEVVTASSALQALLDAVAITDEPASASPTAEPQLAATAAMTSTLPALPTLHVPSPDWRNQIIYFVMTDRFSDGDPSNNDQGFDEYDPADPRKYSGGDLQGLIDRLDYIQNLGATAVWITPPVANQWWNPQPWAEFGGYHGYWAEDFSAVDAHLGDLADYQALSRALHGRGMYLIQDIVANHTGDFFSYKDATGADRRNPSDPAENYRPNDGSVPITAPRQAPFDQNDPANPDHLDAGIYHWTPQMQNSGNVEQRLTYQLAELDDLRTTNPAVREALRASYGRWIEEVGVDAFRIDTVIHVEHDFWHDFVHSDDADAPGMNAVAAAAGRDNFLTFGEAFIGSDPYDDAGERAIATYLGTQERPELMSVLNFPLHFTINRIFAEGAPTEQMAYRLTAAEEHFPDPTLLPVFIDNHDVARFLSKGTTAGLKQALTFLLTGPGIPVIYYGTEQGFTEPRSAMFAGGVGSGGVDRFDPESELYGFIQELTQLRAAHPVFSHGATTVLQADARGPGVLAYARTLDDARAIVLMNTADRPVLMTDLATGLPAGTVLVSQVGETRGDELVVQAGGDLTMELAPRAVYVLDVTDRTEPVTATPVDFAVTTPLAATVFTETLTLSGTVSVADAPLTLILNDDLGRAMETAADGDGQWFVEAPLAGVAPGRQQNTLRIWAPAQAQLSQPFTVTTDLPAIESSVTVYDLVGDTVGPNGTYQLPRDATFGEQLDIVQTTVRAAGPDLTVELTMGEVTDGWNPVNGFDHVLFHVFIDLPDAEDGATVLPHINAAAPDGFEWDYLAFVEGWNNRLFSAADAGPEAYGAPVTPVAAVEADTATDMVTLRIPGEALGNPATLAGARVYVATWDWNGVDSEYRRLTETAQQWTFGGGDGAADPLILDDTAIITVPTAGDVIANEPPGDYAPPGGVTPTVDVTLVVTVPPSTPADARIYATGPWAAWNPADARFQLEQRNDGLFRLTLPVEAGAIFEYRLTRGSFNSAEKLDPADRTANRSVDVPVGETELTIPVTVADWWDDGE